MDIIRIIQETATWVENGNSDFEKNLFRTPELSPKYYYYEIPASQKLATINQINSKRSEILLLDNIELIPIEDLCKFGRIMYFDADDTVVDGAPQVESFCYVDLGDAPPWDTWLATAEQLNALSFFNSGHKLASNFLIAWVPKSHYFYASEALEVACIDNFEWPDNTHISERFACIKPLFAKPEQIIIPEIIPNLANRMHKLKVIMQEAEENSQRLSAELRTRMKW